MDKSLPYDFYVAIVIFFSQKYFFKFVPTLMVWCRFSFDGISVGRYHTRVDDANEYMQGWFILQTDCENPAHHHR